MKVFSRVGLLLAVALMACFAFAVSAQAVVITPDNDVVVGTTDATKKPTLTYGGVTIVCDNSTATGTTGTNSASISDLALTFETNCNLNKQAATVKCVGTATLTAKTSNGADGSGTGTIALNSGFGCEVTVPLTCTVDVIGPQSPTNEGTFNGTTNVLSGTITVTAKRTGNASCGAATGAATFSADYNVVIPTGGTVTIDP